MSTPQHSPLTQRLYDLEYPRSLGVYSTYAEVQAVVDALADRQFPVQNTMIVGTDLKLIERVTGRRTWGKVIGQGVLSGIWMGLFIGLILSFLNPQGNIAAIISSVLLGIIFFTVWAVIGYAMTGGKRDFTSMTATIPMQYELMVEHSPAEGARRARPEPGLRPGPAAGPRTGAVPGQPRPEQGHPATAPTSPASAPSAPAAPSSRPSYGQPAPSTSPAQPSTPRPSYGRPADPQDQPAAPADPSAPAPRPEGEDPAAR